MPLRRRGIHAHHARRFACRHEPTRRLGVRHVGQFLGAVTLSCGVAAFPGHGTDAAALIGAADQALYQAKRTGRDCIVVAEVVGA